MSQFLFPGTKMIALVERKKTANVFKNLAGFIRRIVEKLPKDTPFHEYRIAGMVMAEFQNVKRTLKDGKVATGLENKEAMQRVRNLRKQEWMKQVFSYGLDPKDTKLVMWSKTGEVTAAFIGASAAQGEADMKELGIMSEEDSTNVDAIEDEIEQEEAALTALAKQQAEEEATAQMAATAALGGIPSGSNGVHA